MRVHPALLYSGHPLASVHGPYNAVTVEAPAITEITMSGPGAGGPQTATAVLGDVISAMIPPASTPETTQQLPIVEDVVSAFYVRMEVADRPGVLAQRRRGARLQGCSIKQLYQHGLGEDARLVMTIHPVLESRLYAALQLHRRPRLRPLRAARDPRDRGGVRLSVTGLIERYRERLPFAAEDPVVSLGEGSTPLVLAERVSERVGAEVWLKLEGLNPTGSFKDRGMTCAVSRRGARGRARRSSAPRPATPRRAPPPTPAGPG